MNFINRNRRPTSSGLYILRKIVDRIQGLSQYKVGKTDDFQQRMQSTEYRGAELLYYRATRGYKMAREIETRALDRFSKLYGDPVEGRELFSGDLVEMISVLNHLYETYRDDPPIDGLTNDLEGLGINEAAKFLQGEETEGEWNIIHPEHRESKMIINMKKNWTQYGYNTQTNSVNKKLTTYLCQFHGFQEEDCVPFMKDVTDQQFRARKFPVMLAEMHHKINGADPEWLTM